MDRTLFEGEVAGMWTVHERPDPDNPKLHDANIYELHDAALMYAGHGEWVDPLPPGVLAADVAKARIEERRAVKRAAGQVRKGGVAKGVSTKKLRAQRKAEQERGTTVGGDVAGPDGRSAAAEDSRGEAPQVPGGGST
ncbi:hypothetical protein, partial [Streptomyces lavendulae]|uniref:hypothetical protein n=1 Tax=Streptomyces lavendulae TaxID=1914 RepID=UPI0031EE31E4